jgi:hypothetical protein
MRYGVQKVRVKNGDGSQSVISKHEKNEGLQRGRGKIQARH